MLLKKSFDLIRSGERPPLEHDFPCKHERELAAYEKERLERKEMQATLEILEAEPEIEEEKIVLEEVEEIIVEQVTAPFEGSTYMKLLAQCFKDLNISPTNQPSKQAVEAWISQHAPILKSQREWDYFFTFLREPEMKKGGVFTGKVRKKRKNSIKSIY